MLVRSAAAFLLLAVALSFAACGNSKAGGSSPPSVPAGTTYSLTYGPVTVQPGVENTQCVVHAARQRGSRSTSAPSTTC